MRAATAIALRVAAGGHSPRALFTQTGICVGARFEACDVSRNEVGGFAATRR